MKPRQQRARLMRESALQMPRLIQTKDGGAAVSGWMGWMGAMERERGEGV